MEAASAAILPLIIEFLATHPGVYHSKDTMRQTLLLQVAAQKAAFSVYSLPYARDATQGILLWTGNVTVELVHTITGGFRHVRDAIIHAIPALAHPLVPHAIPLITVISLMGGASLLMDTTNQINQLQRSVPTTAFSVSH